MTEIFIKSFNLELEKLAKKEESMPINIYSGAGAMGGGKFGYEMAKRVSFHNIKSPLLRAISEGLTGGVISSGATLGGALVGSRIGTKIDKEKNKSKRSK